MNIKQKLQNADPWVNDPLYAFESDLERANFKEWFITSAICYNEHIDYSMKKELCSQIIPGGCYGNGQFLSLNNHLKYIEGIVEPDGRYVSDELIPHGFNVIENDIADFTYKKIIDETPSFLSKLPMEYLGVEIPHKYIIEKQSVKNIVPISLHRPLLLQYWRDNFKVNK